MLEKRCIGCGGLLQNTDSTQAFYTPKALDLDLPIYCERCYKIRHYGRVKPSFVSEDVILDTLYQIKKRPGVMILIADALDFYGSIHPFFRELSHQKRTLLVVNKIDLMPKSIKHSHLKSMYLNKAKSYDLNVDECLLVSALKKTEVDTLLEKMFHIAKGQDLYLMGLTNVGKSSLLNALLESKNFAKNQITTSLSPHITQGLIPFRIGHHTLYDTPGLEHAQSYRHYLYNDSLKRIIPMKEIKPRTFQHLSHQAFYFGGLAMLLFKDVMGSMTVYMASTIPVHHNQSKYALDFYHQKVTGFLNPPSTYDTVEPLEKTEFVLNAETSLIFPGLGFVELRNIKEVTVFHYTSVTPLVEASYFS